MKKQGRACACLLGLAILGAQAPWAAAQTLPSSMMAALAASTTQPTSKAVKVHFVNAPIDDVLNYLSETAGYVVIKDNSAPLTSRVTIISQQPMTPDEIVKDLNSILKTDGNTAIQMGRILKITSLANAKHANIPVHIGNDPSQIEENEELITQIIPVHSVDAVKLKIDLTPMVSTDADLTANAASNSLMITDTSANVRRVVEIVSNLDKNEAAANTIKVWQLKYADATAAAKLITDIFNPDQSAANAASNLPPQVQFIRALQGRGGGGGGGGGGGFGGRGGGGGGGPGGGAPGGGAAAAAQEESAAAGHVIASADTRTNTIVVSGPPDTLEIIDGVIKQLDNNPASEETFFLYKVRYGQAVDMAATLNGIFSQNGAVNNTTATRTQNASNSANRFGSTGSGGGIGSGGLGGGGGGGRGGGGGIGGGGTGGVGSGGNRTTGLGSTAQGGRGNTTGGTASASGTPGISDLVGQVYVVADQDTNQLLVATMTKYEPQVRQVIEELDRAVPQVLIKVLIAQVSHDDSLNLGTDFSGFNIRPSGRGEEIGSSLGAAAAAVSSTTPPGMVAALLEKNIDITLQALAQTNKVDILSRPYILTSDNQEADITIGSEIPLVTNTTVDSTGGIHNNATYQPVGVLLTVTPHINPMGEVTMLVSPSISSLSSQSVTIQEGVSLPIINNTAADAYLTVQDGQTVVIGGLMQDQKTESISKIPLLGDIPLIGRLLFSYSTQDKQKNELFIFLTPHVALQPELLKPMSEDEMRGVKLTPNAVEPGTFQEQMRGMARGGSATQPSQPLVVPPPSK